MKKPFKTKQIFKKTKGKCRICGERKYEVLDTHRIIPGGKYSWDNCICVCSKCHRLIHANKIKIIGFKHSSKGRLLHFFNEEGKEKFNP
ncbi:MAG: HNH endonuclease [archaeon]